MALHLLLSLLYGRMEILSGLFNADALYLPALMRDLAAQGTFRDWYLPHAAYFVPDMVLYRTLALGPWTTEQQTYLFTLSLWSFMALSFGSFTKSERERLGVGAASFAVLLLALLLTLVAWTELFMTGGLSGLSSSFFQPLLSSAHHLGSFTLTLLLFTLTLAFERNPETRRMLPLLGLMGITAVAWMSDKLIFAQAIAPLLLYGAFMGVLKRDKSYGIMLLALGLGLVFGQQLHDHLIPHRMGSVDAWPQSWTQVLLSLRVFSSDLQSMAEGPWLLFLGYVLAAWIYSLRRLSLFVGQVLRHGRPAFALRAESLLTLAALINIALVLLKGMYHDSGHIRYLLAFWLFPCFNLGVFLWHRLDDLYAGPWLQKFLPLACGLFALILAAKNISPWHNVYSDERISCVQGAAEQREVEHIVTGYWSAKPLQIFGDQSWKVLTLDAQGQIYHWISSDRWARMWTHSARDPYRASSRFFFIQDGSTQIPDSSLGNELEHFSCGSWQVSVREFAQSTLF